MHKSRNRWKKKKKNIWYANKTVTRSAFASFWKENGMLYQYSPVSLLHSYLQSLLFVSFYSQNAIVIDKLSKPNTIWSIHTVKKKSPSVLFYFSKELRNSHRYPFAYMCTLHYHLSIYMKTEMCSNRNYNLVYQEKIRNADCGLEPF